MNMLSYVRFLRILIWLSSKIDLKIRDILFLLLIDYRYMLYIYLCILSLSSYSLRIL